MAGIRVTNARLLAGVAMPGGLRVTRSSLSYAVGMPGPLRVTNVRILRAQSIHRVFYLPFLDADNEIFGITGYSVELVAGPIPEFNPYKPQVPESLIEIAGRDFFDYIEENQKTLRLQHNITQAGDTTFPYQMIINTHTEQQFRLGSVGKFYHEDYGIVHARYVQFDKMNPDLAACAPVGLIKNTASLDWIVTNRLEISDPALVVGVVAAYIMPVDDQFGWVTIDGVNLQALTAEGSNTTIGKPYVWSSPGKVGPSGNGVVVCRRLQQGGDIALLKGRAYIRLEGSFVDTAGIAQLIADVAQLQEDVQTLEDAANITDTLTLINKQIRSLTNQLVAETNSRRAGDTAINNRIDGLNFVSAAQLTSAINALASDIAGQLLTLNAKIDATNLIALDALNKANQALADSTEEIWTQIHLILTWISEEKLRVKGKFPVVDGSIPPNLVYLDDGSLVYVETF